MGEVGARLAKGRGFQMDGETDHYRASTEWGPNLSCCGFIDKNVILDFSYVLEGCVTFNFFSKID